MRAVLTALAHRRSAISVALITFLSVISPVVYAGQLLGVGDILGALALGVGAYVAAYEAIGRWEKAALGAVIAAAGSFVASLAANLPPEAAVVAAVMAVGAALGVVPALPSTDGSADPGQRPHRIPV